MSNEELEIFNAAGNFTEELESSDVNNFFGEAEPRGLSQDQEGKMCTVSWDCSICPTHTCWC